MNTWNPFLAIKAQQGKQARKKESRSANNNVALLSIPLMSFELYKNLCPVMQNFVQPSVISNRAHKVLKQNLWE